MVNIFYKSRHNHENFRESEYLTHIFASLSAKDLVKVDRGARLGPDHPEVFLLGRALLDDSAQAHRRRGLELAALATAKVVRTEDEVAGRGDRSTDELGELFEEHHLPEISSLI